MPDGLYEQDFLLWTEEQARLLQRLAAGEPGVNMAVDWPHVIEELEAMGRSELKACRALLRQAMAHLLKLHAWPGSGAAVHWAHEVRALLGDAAEEFSPSMRQRLDVAALYADAAYRTRGMEDASGPPLPWPEACPWTLDDLLQPHAGVPALVARLGGA